LSFLKKIGDLIQGNNTQVQESIEDTTLLPKFFTSPNKIMRTSTLPDATKFNSPAYYAIYHESRFISSIPSAPFNYYGFLLDLRRNIEDIGLYTQKEMQLTAHQGTDTEDRSYKGGFWGTFGQEKPAPKPKLFLQLCLLGLVLAVISLFWTLLIPQIFLQGAPSASTVNVIVVLDDVFEFVLYCGIGLAIICGIIYSIQRAHSLAIFGLLVTIEGWGVEFLAKIFPDEILGEFRRSPEKIVSHENFYVDLGLLVFDHNYNINSILREADFNYYVNNPGLREEWNKCLNILDQICNKYNPNGSSIIPTSQAMGNSTIKSDVENSNASEPTSEQIQAESWSNIGQKFVAQGDNEKALDAFQKSLELGPKNPLVWMNVGILLSSMEQKGEAIEAFKSAKLCAPPNWRKLPIVERALEKLLKE